MLELGLVFELIALLHSAAAQKGTVAHRDKGRKAVKQGVDKPIFVGKKRFLAEYVEKVGGRNLVPLHLTDHVGMPRQVLDRFFRYTARQLDRENLLHVLDRNGRSANDDVKRGHHRLDPLYPFGINTPPHGLAAKGRFGFGRANQHLRFAILLALTRQRAERSISLCPKLLVFLVHKSPPSEDQ